MLSVWPVALLGIRLIGLEHDCKALEGLHNRSDVKWTYISPAADFQADGKRPVHTGAGEELTTNAKGESFISYANYAIAVVDEAESGKHVGERISVYAK